MKCSGGWERPTDTFTRGKVESIDAAGAGWKQDGLSNAARLDRAHPAETVAAQQGRVGTVLPGQSWHTGSVVALNRYASARGR